MRTDYREKRLEEQKKKGRQQGRGFEGARNKSKIVKIRKVVIEKERREYEKGEQVRSVFKQITIRP